MPEYFELGSTVNYKKKKIKPYYFDFFNLCFNVLMNLMPKKLIISIFFKFTNFRFDKALQNVFVK